MTMRRLGAGAFVAVVSVAGCSSQGGTTTSPHESVRTATGAIQGGTTDTKDTYAIALVGQTQQGQSLCSGALIAPNLVVSARHCVDNLSDSSGAVICGQTTFTGLMGTASDYIVTTSSTVSQNSTFHQVAQIITPTPTAVCGNDLSLIILADNVPASEATPITPGIQYPLTDHTVYSTTETAIGYGLAGPPGGTDTSGTRRIRQNIEVQCIPGDPSASLDCYKLGYTTADLAENEFITGDGTCEGDSGSSAYEQKSYTAGTPLSMGVLSRGGVSQDGTTCVGGVYTRLDKWASLIISTAQTAAAKGGYPVPAWTQPASGNTSGNTGGTSGNTGGTSGGTSGGTGGTGGTGDGGAPAPGTLGASCTSDSQCDSHNCLGGPSAPANTFTCTQACDASNACPSGFTCQASNCFAGSGTTSAFGASPSSSSGGCSVGLIGDPDPTPWLGSGGIALGLASLFGRRRRRAS